mgnify:CR=1 FL=1
MQGFEARCTTGWHSIGGDIFQVSKRGANEEGALGLFWSLLAGLHVVASLSSFVAWRCLMLGPAARLGLGLRETQHTPRGTLSMLQQGAMARGAQTRTVEYWSFRAHLPHAESRRQVDLNKLGRRLSSRWLAGCSPPCHVAPLQAVPAAANVPASATTHVLRLHPRSPYYTQRHASTPDDALRGCCATLPTTHRARADTSVLGLENPPKIMARAYVANSTTTICLVSSNQDITVLSSPLSSPSPPPPTPYNISRPVGLPFFSKATDYGGYTLKRLPMNLELSTSDRAHWLSRLRSCLRLLIIVLSGAVVCMLMHTIEIYRGNRYIDLRKGELPMVWPAHTNLAPTIILFAIAAGNFLASVAILSLSFKRSFRRPFRSRDLYRIVAGSFGVVMWVTALVVFNLLDKASKASLGRYSCTNANVLTNGRYQYRAVCEEQVRPPNYQLPTLATTNMTYRELLSTPPLAPPPQSSSLSSASPFRPSSPQNTKSHRQQYESARRTTR